MPAAPAPSTRRGRRIERRREEILDAATRVFSEKGYSATTTKDIAAAADTGESTLYGYFPGKRDILIAAAAKTAGLVDTAILQARDLRSRDALVEVVDRVFDVLTTNQFLVGTVVVQAMVDNEILNGFVIPRLAAIYGLLREIFTAHETAGDFRPVDPDLAARMALGMFAALLLPILRGVEPVPEDAERRRMAQASVGILYDGLYAGLSGLEGDR